MSEINNGFERNYEVSDGPIMVNSFSKTFMRDGMPADVPEILKDPRAEDYVTRMLNAFSEALNGIWDKKKKK